MLLGVLAVGSWGVWRMGLRHPPRGNELRTAIRQAADRVSGQWQGSPMELLSRGIGPGTAGTLQVSEVPTALGPLTLELQVQGDWKNRRAALDGRFRLGAVSMELAGYLDREKMAISLPEGTYGLSYQDAVQVLAQAAPIFPQASARLTQAVQRLEAALHAADTLPAMPSISRRQLELALLALPAMEGERQQRTVEDAGEALRCTDITYRLEGEQAAALLAPLLGEGADGELAVCFTLWEGTLLRGEITGHCGTRQVRYTLHLGREDGPISFTAVQKADGAVRQASISWQQRTTPQGQTQTLCFNDRAVTYLWEAETGLLTLLPSQCRCRLLETQEGVRLQVLDPGILAQWNADTVCSLTAAPGGEVTPPEPCLDLGTAAPGDWLTLLQGLAPLSAWMS